MAMKLVGIYKAMTELVRAVISFWKNGEEDKSEKARQSIRDITESVGIRASQTQYPGAEVLTTDLTTRIPQMNSSGPYRHCLRYCVDFASIEDEETDEIFLELWRISRRSQIMVAMVGQLYCVYVRWGQTNVRLNLVVMQDGVMTQHTPQEA